MKQDTVLTMWDGDFWFASECGELIEKGVTSYEKIIHGPDEHCCKILKLFVRRCSEQEQRRIVSTEITKLRLKKGDPMPVQPKYPMDGKSHKEINDWFTYHSPKEDQPERYEALRNQAKELAYLIVESVPPSADRTASLRKLRECIMTANAAIACGE